MTGYQSKKMMAQSRDPEPDDLVKRLRGFEQWLREPAGKNLTLSSDLFDEAADIIEALRSALQSSLEACGRATDRIEQLDEQLSKSQQRADELWQTLVEIHHVIDGKEPNMDGRLWPLFITAVRDRIEALEEVIKKSRKEIEWWALEHGCCAGREIDTLEKIDAALAGEKKDG